MQAQAIYSKLKNFFPNDIQNISMGQITSNFADDFHGLSFLISTSLPHLSIEQIHSLCRRQQKNVMDKILEIKHIDLYQEIANVCPSQKDLKTMPVEEVALKINQYTQKMAMEESMREDSEEDSLSQSQSEEAISEESESMVHPMQIDEIHYESLNEAKGLHNIFEEEYNTHLPWNEMCIYDLN